MPEQIRIVKHLDVDAAADTLVAPAVDGTYIVVYGILAIGFEDGQVFQLKGSADAATFYHRSAPFPAGLASGAGMSLGGQTPIAVLRPGESLYVTTEGDFRIGFQIVYDYLFGEPLRRQDDAFSTDSA